MRVPLRALIGALIFSSVLLGATSGAQAQPVADSRSIPADLSVASMFSGADWVVKGVMIGLVIASIATWTVLVVKQLELSRAGLSAEGIRDALSSARSLKDIPEDVRRSPLLREAEAEIAQSADGLSDPDGLKERLVSRLDRFEAAISRRMTQGVTVLGTIGATAPFVGLFGTVWGIMNSFIGIAEEQTTNLAVVAPGIAEALLATALGLVAAIPAVVAYNHFARRIAAHRAIVADSAAALLRLVSRDLSRGTLPNAGA